MAAFFRWFWVFFFFFQLLFYFCILLLMYFWNEMRIVNNWTSISHNRIEFEKTKKKKKLSVQFVTTYILYIEIMQSIAMMTLTNYANDYDDVVHHFFISVGWKFGRLFCSVARYYISLLYFGVRFCHIFVFILLLPMKMFLYWYFHKSTTLFFLCFILYAKWVWINTNNSNNNNALEQH